MRFEDFRTSSARLHILRAIHKHLPRLREHISQALADATYLRWEYVQALQAQTYVSCTTSYKNDGDDVKPAVVTEASATVPSQVNRLSSKRSVLRFDHGHGWTEFLRYSYK
jgi:hypothetical protein